MKPRVLFLTSSYPTKGNISGPFVQNIARALADLGIDTRVLIYSSRGKQEQFRDEKARITAYPYSFPLPPALHKHHGLIPSIKHSLLAKIELPLYFFATAHYLIKYAKRYDVIHAHWFLPAGLIACLTKPFHKKPVLTTAWGAEFHLKKTPLIKSILNYVNKKSDRVICVSKYMRQQAKKYNVPIKEMGVIANSITTKTFSLPRKKSSKIIIGTVRRLVTEKRIQDLINAVSLLPKKYHNHIELWIIGDGPEREKLQALAQSKNINQITTFFGMVPHTKIPTLLSQMTIYVNPSIQEGMATANIEALCAGCCVVATKGVGNDEVITHKKTGILYKAASAQDLSTSLSLLLDKPTLLQSLQKQGRAHAKHFSSTSIAKQYLKEYQKLYK